MKPTVFFEDIFIFSDPTQNLIEAFETALAEPAFYHVVTMNPEIFLKMEESLPLKTIYQNADWVLADGRGLCWGVKWVTGQTVPLRPGSTLVTELIKENRFSFYLVGASQDVVHQAASQIRTLYPDSKILGIHDGFFDIRHSQEIIDDIAVKRPDFILVGMGCPKQDLFLSMCKTQLSYGIGIGIGGMLEIIAGRKKRAPKWVQAIAMEWVYRCLQDPKRLPRLWFIPQFIFRMIGLKFKKQYRN